MYPIPQDVFDRVLALLAPYAPPGRSFKIIISATNTAIAIKELNREEIEALLDLPPEEYFTAERLRGVGVKPLKNLARISHVWKEECSCGYEIPKTMRDVIRLGSAHFLKFRDTGRKTLGIMERVLQADNIIFPR